MQHLLLHSPRPLKKLIQRVNFCQILHHTRKFLFLQDWNRMNFTLYSFTDQTKHHELLFYYLGTCLYQQAVRKMEVLAPALNLMALC